MTPSILRQLLAVRPFRPFRLVLADGQTEVPVTAPDRIQIREDALVVHTPDGHVHTIFLDHPIGIRQKG